jgi:hypothetical protein
LPAVALIRLWKPRKFGMTLRQSVPPALHTLAWKLEVCFAEKAVSRPTVLSTLHVSIHGGANWNWNVIWGSGLSVESMYIKGSIWEARC